MPLSRPVSFHLLASIILFFLAGSAAPTPLYGVYQATWGFSPITTTIVFGIYALAVLTALLVVGALSDHVGRRPVLLVATLVQAATMILFATAGGAGALMVARVVQGLATGAAAGAVGAGLLDLDRTRGASANAVAPMLGTATGSLASGLFVTYLPAPTALIYLALAAIFVAQAIGVWFMPETAARRPGALASLRPQFRIPARARGAILVAIPTMIACWALIGFFAALGPALVRKLAGSPSLVLGGLALFVLGTSGALTVHALRERTPRALLVYGLAGLAAGATVALLAISLASVPLFFASLIVAGSGMGAAFQGSIRTVVPLAAPEERAGVLSILYVIAYLSMGLPAVLAGVRVVYGGGLVGTARELAIAVIGLAVAALAGTLLGSASRRPPAPARVMIERS